MAVTSFQLETVFYPRTSSEHAGQINVTYTPYQCDLLHFCLNNAAKGSATNSHDTYLYYFVLYGSNNTSFGVKRDYHYVDDNQRDITNSLIEARQDADTDSAVTRAGNGGNILTLANTPKYNNLYFGGVQQDAASIMAFLNEKFGTHSYYIFDSYYTIQSRPVTEYPELWNIGVGDTESMEISAPFTDPVACPNAYTPNIQGLPEWVDLTGVQVGYPQDLDGGANDFAAFMLFGEPINPKHVKFDVYINGTKDPSIAVRWSGEGDQSFQTTNPIVWCYPTAMGMDEPLITVDGITVPNDSEWYVAKHAYTWGGGYDGNYLSESGDITSGLTDFEKVVKYGFDGIPGSMHYYIRANQQVNADNTSVMTWGNLYDVFIPREINSLSDIIVNAVSNSSNDPRFTDSIEIHLGLPPSDADDDSEDYPTGEDVDGNPGGVYDPDYVKPDFSDGESVGFPGHAVLTKTYSMLESVLQNVGTKLWSQSYFDVLKIQNNPIENIVSCKWFPFSVTGAVAEIKVGDIAFGINGSIVPNVYQINIGSVKYTGAGNYLDCSPYATLKLHLPYCGTVQLDASEMYNRVIAVKYIVDLITGDCEAIITVDGYPYMGVAGHCGVDIPLTSSNRQQQELKASATAISATVGAASHVISGDIGGAMGQAAEMVNIAGMDYTTQRTASHSPACASFENRTVFLEVFKPAFDKDLMNNGFKSRHGWPCHKFITLNKLSGFVQCDARTRIDFAMTGDENEMLENLLVGGVYI